VRPRIALTLVLAMTTVALAAGAGSAAPSAKWARISGPTQPGVQLGLARTADGVLHVIWNRGATPTSIFETRLSPAGRATGTSTVASGWDGNGGLALLTMPDKSLRLFAAGGTHPNSPAYGINTLTAPAAGGAWKLDSGVYWGGAVAGAAGAIGAALTKDGTPATAWRGYAGVGLPAQYPPNAYEADMTYSQLAADASTGAVVMGGLTISGKGGVYVQQVLPSLGSKVVLPLASSLNDWNASLSGRVGAAGVYVAYADGKAAHLYRYGGGSKTFARGAFTSASACPGPDGRLWVAWGGSAAGLFVTRSSRAVGAFERVQKLALPHGTDGFTFLQCEGSDGPLDLFADANVGGATGFWHTRLLAQMSLRAHSVKTKVTLVVRDAGDPLAGVSINLAGHRLKTDAKGQASVTLRAGTYSAHATAPGYAAATARVTVKAG
jgi:hypothetical protein